MALCSSGAMSMGGSTVGRSINCELGCSGTAEISLNDADVRNLAGVSSGAISLDDFYGASSFPTTLGEEFGGGYYISLYNLSGSCYYLIVAPNATGCACCQMKTSQPGFTGAGCTLDGYNNTYCSLNDPDAPAAQWAISRNIGGFDDWYVPAVCELKQVYNDKSFLPAGEGFAVDEHWTSTEGNSFNTCTIEFVDGSDRGRGKISILRVRATRRVNF